MAGEERIEIQFERFATPDLLPEGEDKLLEMAMQAAEGAYAPHSGFLVGCAVELQDGEILTGNNQENKAYPSGLCAERSVLFYAGAKGKGDKIRKIAVRARSLKTKVNVPVTPCGACRQVMLEYEQLGNHPIVVIMQGETGEILRVKGIGKSLLPFGFDLDI